jgi:hypothetical protein
MLVVRYLLQLRCSNTYHHQFQTLTMLVTDRGIGCMPPQTSTSNCGSPCRTIVEHKCKPWLGLQYLFAPQVTMQSSTGQSTAPLFVSERQHFNTYSIKFAVAARPKLVWVTYVILRNLEGFGSSLQSLMNTKTSVIKDSIISTLLAVFRSRAISRDNATAAAKHTGMPMIKDC